MDDYVQNGRHQRFGYHEIIEPPAYIPLAGLHDISPPGILDSLRIQLAIGIAKTMLQVGIDPDPFFRQETGILLIDKKILALLV